MSKTSMLGSRASSTARQCRLAMCLSLLAGLSCSDSSNSPTDTDDDPATGRDASSSADATTIEDAAPPPSDSGSANDASTASDASAASDASTDAAVTPKPITATYVYQGGNGGSPYPFHTYLLNRTTGALTQVGGNKDLGPSPTYIAPSADGRFLYVANEDYGAGVTAASIGADHTPTKLETQQVESGSSELNAMVFTSLSPNGKYVLAANYYGGRVVSFPVEANGSLGSPVSSFAFASDAKTHSVRVDRTGSYAFAPNLETNNIGQLLFNSSTGQLTANTPSTISAAPPTDETEKAGPRHIALHPSKPYAYVANELNSTITAYTIANNGTLSEIETKSSLPEDTQDRGNVDTAAHVLVHPNGNFVYMSNRGYNNIAVFSVATNGSLTLLENEPTRGSTPRNFDIDSEGQLMVVANQDSGSLAVFSIGSDGLLSPLGPLVEGLTTPNSVAIVNVRGD